MKKTIFIISFICFAVFVKAAVDVPISFHTRTDINMMKCTADAGGEYTFVTTGADPYVSSDKTSISTIDHSVFSFEYIAEEGIDQVMIYFSSPAAEGYTAFISNLPPTTEWKTATINLSSNPNWRKNANETVLRLDFGNIANKTIRIRNSVMKATLLTPLTLNLTNTNDLAASEAGGEYTLATSGIDPYIYANNVNVSSSDVFILSFDYIANTGIDKFQFYFYADGETLSEDKSAILSNVPAATAWKNVQINLKNSDGMWNKKAVQSSFRIDVGTVSGKTIKLRNISIRDGSGLLTTSFPIKLATGTQNADMTVTESPANTWNIQTTGSDPNMATVGFKQMYNPAIVKYLSYQYKSTSGISDMDVYYYNPTNGGPTEVSADYKVNPGTSIPTATVWTDNVIDMSTSPKWKDAGSFRLDFGNNAGKNFAIRNITLSDSLSIARTVSYNTQSEINISSVNTYYKAIISAPLVPMRIGYSLVGWYKEPACINAWDFALEKVISNTTLYAKWSVVATYTVTFNSQGGSIVTAITTNTNTTIPAPADPAKTQFEFGGWYKEPACTNAWNFATEKVTATTTLYASWVGYSVYFDSRGGSPVSKIHANYNTTISEPAAPTKTGYTFQGWYKDFLCQNAWDFANDKVTATTTLLARWMGNGIIPLTVSTAPSRLKYFGYYLVDTYVDDPYDGVAKSDYTDEVSGFTNLNHIAVFSANENVVARVNSMKSQCMKPFLGLENIFFYVDGGTNSPSGRHFAMYSDYKNRWNTFKLTNSSVLNASKIGCFYMADEPTWNGITFEELNTVCQLVKNDFPAIPVFFIEAYPEVGVVQIPTCVDWVGFDRYWIMKPYTDGTFLSDLATLKTRLSTPQQKIFLVPDTRWIPQYEPTYGQSPAEMDATILDYYKIAVADTTIIGMVGYEWPGGFDGPGTLGARNLPQNVIDVMVKIGQTIKANNTYCPVLLPPSAPTGLAATDIGLTKFTLTWTASANVGGVSTYEVSRNGVFVATTTSTSISVPGLTCATVYQMTVKARYEGSNWSAESAPLPVTTLECVPCTLPAIWTGTNIGNTQQTACEYQGTFTYGGTGVEAANVAYNFRFTHSALKGDGFIIARIDNILNPDPFAKSGVMIRESLASGSKFVACYVSTDNGISFHVKAGSGATTSTVVTGFKTPCWVKLVRIGDLFSAYYSTDGANWVQVGSSAGIVMAADLLSGLAVTSRKACPSCTSDISNVSTGVETALSDPAGFSTEISVFPNPATSGFSLTNVPKNAIISVLSMDGKLMDKTSSDGNGNTQVNVLGWRKGIYLVKIQTTREVKFKKVIVE